MNDEYVTLNEIKQLLADNKKSKQLAIYKVADLCGTWYTDGLLSKAMNERDCLSLRKLYIAFRDLQVKSSDGIYKQLYSVLQGYFERMSSIELIGKYNRRYVVLIGSCNQRAYNKLCDILLDEDYYINESQIIRSRVYATEDGVVTDIRLEII